MEGDDGFTSALPASSSTSLTSAPYRTEQPASKAWPIETIYSSIFKYLFPDSTPPQGPRDGQELRWGGSARVGGGCGLCHVNQSSSLFILHIGVLSE